MLSIMTAARGLPCLYSFNISAPGDGFLLHFITCICLQYVNVYVADAKPLADAESISSPTSPGSC
jgi:hypothetical protein